MSIVYYRNLYHIRELNDDYYIIDMFCFDFQMNSFDGVCELFKQDWKLLSKSP